MASDLSQASLVFVQSPFTRRSHHMFRRDVLRALTGQAHPPLAMFPSFNRHSATFKSHSLQSQHELGAEQHTDAGEADAELQRPSHEAQPPPDTLDEKVAEVTFSSPEYRALEGLGKVRLTVHCKRCAAWAKPAACTRELRDLSPQSGAQCAHIRHYATSQQLDSNGCMLESIAIDRSELDQTAIATAARTHWSCKI